MPLFDLGAPPPPELVRAARTFETKLEEVCKLLRGAIDDNQVTAVRRVDPGRAGTIADMLAAMKVDVGRLETAFRVTASLNQGAVE